LDISHRNILLTENKQELMHSLKREEKGRKGMEKVGERKERKMRGDRRGERVFPTSYFAI